MVDQHKCSFTQITLEEGDEDSTGHMKVGMDVLLPCECGQTPLDELEFLQRESVELQSSLLAQEPYRWLYHWSPASRRRQINRYGLRPRQRTTTSTEGFTGMALCLADSPSWAWALTLQGRGHDGEWDLWQTSLNRIIDPIVLATPDRPSGLHEVRTEHRIYKRDLWHVGSREK